MALAWGKYTFIDIWAANITWRIEILIPDDGNRCEYKAPLYRYLRANSDILNFEIIGELDDQVTADGEGPMPVLPPSQEFSDAMGGREGFFLKFTGRSQTNRTPEERLNRFLMMMGMYFPPFSIL